MLKFIIGLFVGILIGLFWMAVARVVPLHHQAIEFGYARHNSTNGEWEWILKGPVSAGSNQVLNGVTPVSE